MILIQLVGDSGQWHFSFSDEGTPVMSGHFRLVPRVSLEGRFYCTTSTKKRFLRICICFFYSSIKLNSLLWLLWSNMTGVIMMHWQVPFAVNTYFILCWKKNCHALVNLPRLFSIIFLILNFLTRYKIQETCFYISLYTEKNSPVYRPTCVNY